VLHCRVTLQIGNHTIKLSMLNKDSKWTKALKLMLANLKVCQSSTMALGHISFDQIS